MFWSCNIRCCIFAYSIYPIRKLAFGIDVSGYASLLIAVLFLGGIIELSLGILGEYIANIYLEAKDRPIYIIQDTNIKESKYNH